MTRGPGDQTAASAAGHGRFLASHTDREQVVDTLKAAFADNEGMARAFSPLAFVYLMALLIGLSHLVDSRLGRRGSRRSGGQPRDRD